MNRISGPDGLPHSCAEMVRPSGVFTLIGLCFSCCPRPGCAIARRNTAATVNLARRLPRRDIVIANPPCLTGTISLDRSRSEEHTSELQSQFHLVCRLLLEKKKK